MNGRMIIILLMSGKYGNHDSDLDENAVLLSK